MIRVIVADRNLINATGLDLALKRLQKFDTAGIAMKLSELRKMLLDVSPDVVLLDFALGADVHEVIKEIKDLSGSARVIIMCDRADSEAAVALLTAGANGCISKACSIDALGLAIESIVYGATWIDESVAQMLMACAAERLNQILADASTSDSFCLSSRELQVLELICSGMSNHEIAQALFLSSETVKTHITHIFQKLGVKSRSQALIIAMKHGIVPLVEHDGAIQSINTGLAVA